LLSADITEIHVSQLLSEGTRHRAVFCSGNQTGSGFVPGSSLSHCQSLSGGRKLHNGEPVFWLL
jgi:hypothetical protein